MTSLSLMGVAAGEGRGGVEGHGNIYVSLKMDLFNHR